MEESMIEFLFRYHPATDDMSVKMEEIRLAAMQLAKIIDKAVPPSADRSDAIRQLQNCVNTANRGIVFEGKGYR